MGQQLSFSPWLTFLGNFEMKMFQKIALTAALALGASSAQAAVIVGTGAPITNAALTGGTVVNFDGVSGNYTNYVTPGVTIAGASHIGGTYANNYNTFGNSLDNMAGGTQTLTFNFVDAVSAFAFNFGASDVVWTLTAFSGANALESTTINPTTSSNTKSYFGLTGNNITSAKLTHSGGDYVFVDNLTFAGAGAVPEPATWAMMIIGFGAVGASMRRRKVSAAATACA